MSGGVELEETQDDVLADFFSGVAELAAECQRRLCGKRLSRCGSRAAAWAVEAGLPPQMSYTLRETAQYSGIEYQTLLAEVRAGRLAATIPAGCERGYRVRADEMDRWMEENTKGGRP